MPFSRYDRSPVLALGTKYGTSDATVVIRDAIASGELSVKELEIHENQRLDTLAGSIYGESRYWWVLAAASNIGWGLQLPPGTVILVPELSDVAQIVG